MDGPLGGLADSGAVDPFLLGNRGEGAALKIDLEDQLLLTWFQLGNSLIYSKLQNYRQ